MSTGNLKKVYSKQILTREGKRRMLCESGCAALGGTHAALVGGSEACIGKRDDPDEVATSLYQNEYNIEAIILPQFWGELSTLILFLYRIAISKLRIKVKEEINLFDFSLEILILRRVQWQGFQFVCQLFEEFYFCHVGSGSTNC